MTDEEKKELLFYKGLSERQSKELGRLTTEVIKSNMTIENLKNTLQNLIKETNNSKEEKPSPKK